MKTLLNEWKPSNFDQMPSVIRLYHGTDIDALNNIYDSGVISARMGNMHGETRGVNWFSIHCSDNYNAGALFSIDIPKEDFNKGVFEFMNNSDVTSRGGEIPIANYNLQIVKIGGWDNEIFENAWHMSDEDPFTFVEFCMKNNRILAKGDYSVDDKIIQQIIRQIGHENSLKELGIVESVNHINEVEADDVDLSSFEVKDELNPKFWINDKLNSRVREKLLDLADDFIDSLSVRWVKPKDIVFTGSLANYNWSKYSDIDIHIIVKYKDVYEKKEFVEDYFNMKKEEWSRTHESLKIYGFPVEMYVEDEDAPAVSSGVYSLNDNKWITKPKNLEDARYNTEYVKEMVAKFMTDIDNIDKKMKKTLDKRDMENLSTRAKKVFDKLKGLRKEGLKTKSKEMSSGNIIWKCLRRNDYLERIWDIINNVYNKINSLK